MPTDDEIVRGLQRFARDQIEAAGKELRRHTFEHIARNRKAEPMALDLDALQIIAEEASECKRYAECPPKEMLALVSAARRLEQATEKVEELHRPGELELTCGEMTADERRTARALVKYFTAITKGDAP